MTTKAPKFAPITGEAALAMRKKLNVNQSEFWSRVGIGQSAGSRYESGRNIPRPVQMLLRTERSPMSAMADWLAGEAPEGFTIDQDFALQSISEDRARATFKGHDLEDTHVLEHLEAGRLPIKLAMTFDDRLSFVLTERGEIKRLDFLDVIRDQVKADEHEDAQSIFDAEFALMTGELLRLLPAVVGAMGGEIQRAPDLVDQAKEAA